MSVGIYLFVNTMTVVCVFEPNPSSTVYSLTSFRSPNSGFEQHDFICTKWTLAWYPAYCTKVYMGPPHWLPCHDHVLPDTGLSSSQSNIVPCGALLYNVHAASEQIEGLLQLSTFVGRSACLTRGFSAIASVLKLRTKLMVASSQTRASNRIMRKLPCSKI
jgi:hypothetical protein